MTLLEVSNYLNATLIGKNFEFDALNIPMFAKENNLSFLSNDESFSIIKKSKCMNFIVSNRLFLPKGKNYIVVDEDPRLAISKLLYKFKNINVNKNIIIGKNTFIEDNVKIYDNVIIGDNVKIYSGSVIGKPGFSHYKVGEEIITFNGIGSVIIKDNVEIGSNTCIDAGIFTNTLIGESTKIDNFCQIGHDVIIGKRCIICSQVGIAGHVKIGDDSILYGKVGVRDRVILGNNFIGKAYSAITKSFATNSIVSGIPARDKNKLYKSTKR